MQTHNSVASSPSQGSSGRLVAISQAGPRLWAGQRANWGCRETRDGAVVWDAIRGSGVAPQSDLAAERAPIVEELPP